MYLLTEIVKKIFRLWASLFTKFNNFKPGGSYKGTTGWSASGCHYYSSYIWPSHWYYQYSNSFKKTHAHLAVYLIWKQKAMAALACSSIIALCYSCLLLFCKRKYRLCVTKQKQTKKTTWATLSIQWRRPNEFHCTFISHFCLWHTLASLGAKIPYTCQLRIKDGWLNYMPWDTRNKRENSTSSFYERELTEKEEREE